MSRVVRCEVRSKGKMVAKPKKKKEKVQWSIAKKKKTVMNPI